MQLAASEDVVLAHAERADQPCGVSRSATRGPGALASARCPGVASKPGATLSSRLGVANQQGFAGHFDCCPGLRRALLQSSPL